MTGKNLAIIIGALLCAAAPFAGALSITGTATIDERSTGTGNFGEVEDYALTIGAQPALSVSSVTTTEGIDNYAVFTVSLSRGVDLRRHVRA